jgi:hypothetical protein
MDVRLFLTVIWRYRRLAAAGLVVAVVLAALAYGSPALNGVKPTLKARGSETWQSQSKILITQQGFPYGRAVPQYRTPTSDTQAPAVQLGDQSRFSGLSQVYANLFNSDAVRQQIVKSEGAGGTVDAKAEIEPASGLPLPLIAVTVTAPSAAGAAALASHATRVFEEYVGRQQAAAGIMPGDRIELQTLQRGHDATLVQPHRKTASILIFIAVLGATLAAILVLENAQVRHGEREPELGEKDRPAPHKVAA